MEEEKPMRQIIAELEAKIESDRIERVNRLCPPVQAPCTRCGKMFNAQFFVACPDCMSELEELHRRKT